MAEQQRLSPAERANLVAYLDGELNDAESRAIATKLTQSVTARRELDALEKTWELLELLPRPRPSTEFTAKTLTIAKDFDARDGRLLSAAGQTAQRLISVLILCVSSILTLAFAYAATRWLWPDPSARLERELSLAEHIDEYRDIGSFEYLKLLDESPIFKDEASLVPSADDVDATPDARLRVLPREQRLALSKNLQEFDLLSPSEQAAARELDKQLASLPAEDRTRLNSLMHRYHLWMLSLPDAKRREVMATPEDARLALVDRYRDQTYAQKMPKAELLRLQFALLMSPLSLFETAHLIKIWLVLPPEERKRIEQLRPVDRVKSLHGLGPANGVAEEKRPTNGEWEKVRQYVNSKERYKKRIEALKAQSKAQNKETPPRREMEAFYFLDHDPAAVEPRKLYQFESAIPPWIRDQLDPLPPEAARRRLRILYRLVFPEGQEMPDPPPKSEPSKSAPPAPRTKAQPPRPGAPAGVAPGSSPF